MIAAQILLVVGAAFTLVAAIGVNRFRGVLERMHIMSKASTFGFLLVLAGGIVALDGSNPITFLVLAGLLQLLTSPVSSNLMARATYRAEGIATSVGVVDELAAHVEAIEAAEAGHRPGGGAGEGRAAGASAEGERGQEGPVVGGDAPHR